MEGNNAFHDGFSFDSTRCRTVTCKGWDRLYSIKIRSLRPHRYEERAHDIAVGSQ